MEKEQSDFLRQIAELKSQNVEEILCLQEQFREEQNRRQLEFEKDRADFYRQINDLNSKHMEETA